MNNVYINLCKINSFRKLENAGKHNLRLIHTEIGIYKGGKIEPSKSHLNQVLEGPSTPKEIEDLARALVEERVTKKLRKDAVIAVEIIFSPKAGFSKNLNLFFSDCLLWTKDFYKLPILSAISHFDEQVPHLHVLMLPLVGNRMIGSSIVGYKGKLKYAKESFFRHLATKYQLIQPVRPENFSPEQREAISKSVIYRLFSLKDMGTWNTKDLINILRPNPFPLAQALGIEIPQCMRSQYIEEIIKGKI
jgi:Plasmid recombination enzyme